MRDSLTAAYQRLSEKVSEVSGRRPPLDCNEVLDAVRGFVHEVHRDPTCSAEFDRRATFIENGCREGSAWKKAGDRAARLLRARLESDSFCQTNGILSETGKARPHWCLTETPIGYSSQLRDYIRLAFMLQTIDGLPKRTVAALEEWRRLSEELRTEAESTAMEADGGRLLRSVHTDLTSGPSAQSGAVTLLKGVTSTVAGGMFQSMLDAAGSLLTWAGKDLDPIRAQKVKASGDISGEAVKKSGPWSRPIPKKELREALGISENTLKSRLTTSTAPMGGRIRYRGKNNARKIECVVADLPEAIHEKLRRYLPTKPPR
jgi:hypothetical protein